MGQLRTTWQAAKDDSARTFNAVMGIDDLLTHGWKYPLNFNQNLGPTLDNYEGAKGKNPAKAAEHKKKAEETIKKYEQQISSNHDKLKFKIDIVDKKDPKKKTQKEVDAVTILTTALTHIKGELK